MARRGPSRATSAPRWGPRHPDTAPEMPSSRASCRSTGPFPPGNLTASRFMTTSAPDSFTGSQHSEAVVSIPEGDLLEGHIPPAKMRLLLAWIEIHRDELIADWDLAVSGQQPFKIDPLR